MARAIIALYDDFATAQRVVEQLVEAGLERSNISLVANDASGEYATRLQSSDYADDVHSGEGASFGAVVGALVGLGAMLIPGIGPVIAAGPLVAGLVGAGVGAAAGAVTGGITASLVKLGVDEESAGYYAEGIRRGGTLVTAHVADEWHDRVLDIMKRHDPVDINTRAENWQASDSQGFDERSPTYQAENVQRERQNYTNVDDEARLEVVEEELKVGKREIERGGVWVSSYITETPVEEQVRLREERVSVERHLIDRKATDADFMTGEETYEVQERAEEVVLNKEARVVEEVVIKKDVQERTETIHDTVRRKDVNVEQVGTTANGTTRGFETYNTTFRNHYKSNYANTGYDYDYYSPAYQFGYTLANDQRYRDYDWSQIESEARTRWEENNCGTWDRIKDAVRNAWESVKDAVD